MSYKYEIHCGSDGDIGEAVDAARVGGAVGLKTDAGLEFIRKFVVGNQVDHPLPQGS